MQKYPFTRCLKPRQILNPYTLERIIVECGDCPACSLRKSQLNAMKVRLESISHKFSMFITLTYNNVSLPKMLVKACNMQKDDCGEVYDTGEAFSLIDITQRLGIQGNVLGYTDDYYNIVTKLSKKVELPKCLLPHLSKYDAQLFIKRLRRNIDLYYEKGLIKEKEQIRYYLVGEYGPVHFRPHYHVILWFESEELYKVIRQIIYKSWSFGRIDCQKSLGKCSDYVAKYLNCSVSLPDVFKGKQVRPFCTHSSHLGEKVLEMSYQEVYENEFESVIRKCIPDFSPDSDVFLWRSLKTFYFPKCKGYSQKSEHERLYSYKTYVNVYRWTKETCVANQARIVTNSILKYFYHHDDIEQNYDCKIVEYFMKSSMFNPWNYEGKSFKEHLDDVYRRVYMELRLSKHFHRFVCKGFINNYVPMLKKIDEFWKNNDLMYLSNQLQQESEFGLSEWFEGEESFTYFYHNVPFNTENFFNTKAFNTFKEVTSKNSEYAVKHKKLNDLNKIYL